MKNKIVSLLLVIAMLFGFASCRRDKETDESKGNGGLNIEVEELEYSEGAIAEATAGIVDLVTKIVGLLGYSEQIKNEDIEKIGDVFKNEVIPILVDVRIYPSELESLLLYADECVEIAEGADKDRIKTNIISDLYSKFSAVLDKDRLGALVYELHVLAINKKLESAKEKYDKHGYAFYLEDVEYYNSLIKKAGELGREKFCDAVSVLTFTISAFNESADFDDSGVSISAGDAVAILERQGKEFAKLELNSTDWQTVAEMCEAFIPKSPSDTLESKLLVILGNEDFFISAADAMTDLIEFYTSLTEDISEESIPAIENKEEYAYEIAICRELMKKESELRVFLSKIEEKVPGASRDAVTLMSSFDKDGYTKFESEYYADSDALILAIKAFVESPTGENYGLLESAYLGYAARINSAIAYVYLYK